tara:strand:+ start:904 stop:1347 length:444 start_codon:yes stop_codon:yes gene_type:complete
MLLQCIFLGLSMKLKSFIFMCLMGLMASAFSGSHHLHPEAKPATGQAKTSLKWPGYCEIEIINDSFSDVIVTGVFDDGSLLNSFAIPAHDAPHYISLYYYGYCHNGMDLYIDSLDGYRLYSGYTPNRTGLHIVPYLNTQLKIKIEKK